MNKRYLAGVTTFLVAMSALAGCAASSSGKSSAASTSKAKIAFLLPCTTCASWVESIAHPGMIADVKKLDPSAEVLYSNGGGSDATIVANADAALAQGAKVLVYETLTPAAGLAIAAKAKAAHVPIVSFDGLLTASNVAFYVSFDNSLVGALQGQYMVDHLAKGSNVAVVNGLDTGIGDVFKKGVHSALDPAFSSGQLHKAFEADTDWNPTTGQQKMTQGLTAVNNKVAGVVATNDGLAGGVISALKAQGLAGKVLVTGQDATLPGLQDILEGTQSATVYKDIAAETQVAAEAAVALAKGDTAALKALTTTTTNNGAGDIPSAILKPVLVTKDNMQIVVDQKVYTWAQICNGIPAADCPKAS